jgi:hypothetical protein
MAAPEYTSPAIELESRIKELGPLFSRQSEENARLQERVAALQLEVDALRARNSELEYKVGPLHDALVVAGWTFSLPAAADKSKASGKKSCSDPTSTSTSSAGAGGARSGDKRAAADGAAAPETKRGSGRSRADSPGGWSWSGAPTKKAPAAADPEMNFL